MSLLPRACGGIARGLAGGGTRTDRRQSDRRQSDRSRRDGGEYRRLLGGRARAFALATRLLPREQREAVTVLYAFCRTVDDLADEYPPQLGAPLLDQWASWVAGLVRGETPPAPPAAPGRPAAEGRFLAEAVIEVVERYGVPPAYLGQLVGGVRSDLAGPRFGTFADLRDYAYRVAGTVGLAMCHILGVPTPEAKRCAVRLGIAMQLTNVLRDVGEDLGRGRVYLPIEDFDRFDGALGGLAARCVTPGFARLMALQIRRARVYYAAGLPGVLLLPPACRLSILVAGQLYRAILDDIERRQFDVFACRAGTSGWQKLRLLGQAYLTLHVGQEALLDDARHVEAASSLEVAAT